MARVYSYKRFSSKGHQEHGDSTRRQKQLAADWLAVHPEHILDTDIRLSDLGISAFRGANLDADKGDLGKFIHLAKTGMITPGSILLLESLDRFSRQPARRVLNILSELVDAGVVVQTLSPCQEINSTNIDNLDVVLPVVISMQLAHQQSKEKSQRVGQAKAQRRKLAYETGKPMTRICRAWLRFNEKTQKFEPIPSAVQAINHLFQLVASGMSLVMASKEMTKKFKPISRGKQASGVWGRAYIHKILTDRAVLGECVPTKRNGDGMKVNQQPIPNYYPRIVDDGLFYRCQSVLKHHKFSTGRQSDFVNLFSGLFHGSDNYKWHIVKKGAAKYQYKRLVSWGRICGKEDASKLSIDYWQVETMILTALDELKPETINEKPDSQLPQLIGERDGIQQRLSELGEALTRLKSPSQTILASITALETRLDTLTATIENIKQTAAIATTKPLASTQDIIRHLSTITDTQQLHETRLKLRNQIAALVSKIVLVPRKEGRRVKAGIIIEMRDGGQRIIVNLPENTQARLLNTKATSAKRKPAREHQDQDQVSKPAKPDTKQNRTKNKTKPTTLATNKQARSATKPPKKAN
jgi:hypothetical protein